MDVHPLNQERNTVLSSFRDLGKNQQKILLYMGKENGEGIVTKQDLVKYMVPFFRTENSAQNSVTSSLQRLHQRELVENTNPNVQRLSSVKLSEIGEVLVGYLNDLQDGGVESIGGKFVPNNGHYNGENLGLNKDRERIRELEKETEELRLKVETLKKKTEALERQKSEPEIDVLKPLKGAKEEIKLLQLGKQQLKSKVKALEKEGKTLRIEGGRQIQELKKEREELKSKIKSMGKKAKIPTKDLKKPLQEAEGKIQELEKERDELKSEVKDLKGQIEGLAEKKPDNSQGIAELKKEIEELKTDLEELGNSGTHLENLIFYLQYELGPRLTGEQSESLRGELSKYPEDLFQ